MDAKIKSVLFRFLRAFASGAVANMVVISPFMGSSWKDIGVWMAALTMSAIVGGITGLILAADKWLRMK